MEKQFFTMKELAELIQVGKTNLYGLVPSDGFSSIIIHRRILIPVDEFQKWVKPSVGKKNHSILANILTAGFYLILKITEIS